jgi:hypothetical protein
VLPDLAVADKKRDYCEIIMSSSYWDNNHSVLYQPDDIGEDQLSEIADAKSDLVRYILQSLDTILSARDKDIFLLYIDGTYSQDQIAKMLGVSRTPIKTSLYGSGQRPGSIQTIQNWTNTDTHCKNLLNNLNKSRGLI